MDRNLAHEISSDGLLFENGGHFSSGSGTPTHNGLAGDWYFKTTDATVWRLPTNGTAWVRLSATDIPFVNTGTSIRGTDVDAILKEFRKTIVYDPDELASTLNGTHQLDYQDNTLHIVTGTATGYSVKLPDATTLFKGAKFEIPNKSTQAITIKDYAGTSLATLNVSDVLIATLQNNSTSAGTWVLLAISSIASGVNAYNVTASDTFSTSSTTDTILTGITYTPPSGTYGAWFSANLNVGTNNARSQCVIFKDGTAVNDTRRTSQGAGSNFKTNFQTLGIISVNGSQALDVRVNVSSGSIDITGRSFLLIRLGAA